MAVEVAKQRRLYNQFSMGIDVDVDSGPDDYKREQKEKKKEPKTPDAPMGVYYNYVHDLESVWWIAVWALFNFEKEHADEIDSSAATERKINKFKLFSGIVRNMDRFDFFLEPDNYKEATKWVPTYFKDFALTLDTIANAIRKFYIKKAAKKINRILWDESSTIHGKFILLLSELEMEEFEIVRVPGIDDKIVGVLGIDGKIVHIPGIDGEIVHIYGTADEIPSAKRRTDEQDSERSNKRQR